VQQTEATTSFMHATIAAGVVQRTSDEEDIDLTTSPRPKNPLISAQMRRMPRTSTKPELLLRRALFARGLRFRVNCRTLPGSPDLVFSRARLAVFVDGCFWHACPDHGVLPKSNREWWRAKLAGNHERDARKDAELLALGWTPLHLWEHVQPAQMADIVEALWRASTGRS
jgi:DNA mismatch endonuclease (patch repair protein)